MRTTFLGLSIVLLQSAACAWPGSAASTVTVATCRDECSSVTTSGPDVVYFETGVTSPVQIQLQAADGGPPRTLVTAHALTALSADETFVYFARLKAWDIETVGSVERISKEGGPPDVLLSDVANVAAIASDAKHVYVLTSQSLLHFGKVFGSILRIPKSGGPPFVLAEGLMPGGNLVMDQDSLYWTGAMEGDIVSVPKHGGAVRTVAREARCISGLARSGTALFCVAKYGQVVRIPTDGGPLQTIAEVPNYDPYTPWLGAIAARGSMVYFSHPFAKTVFGVPTHGGERQVLATGIRVRSLTANHDALFFVDELHDRVARFR